MKHIVKFIVKIIGLVVLAVCVFIGYTLIKVNQLRQDFESAGSFKYDITYHMNEDSDVFEMSQYESDSVPVITRWLALYIKKMEQGGSISGSVTNDVIHGEVYAEGEEIPSIEFYYDDQVVFGIKRTMDYIINTVEKETNVSLTLLKDMIPDGYVTYEQIQILLGLETAENPDKADLVQEAKEIYDTLKWVIPVSGKDTYFSATLADVKMFYCAPIAAIDGADGAQIKFGIGQKEKEIYLYVRMNDVNESEGGDLEVLMHIQIEEGNRIIMPEVISDDIIHTLASVIQIINGLVK